MRNLSEGTASHHPIIAARCHEYLGYVAMSNAEQAKDTQSKTDFVLRALNEFRLAFTRSQSARFLKYVCESLYVLSQLEQSKILQQYSAYLYSRHTAYITSPRSIGMQLQSLLKDVHTSNETLVLGQVDVDLIKSIPTLDRSPEYYQTYSKGIQLPVPFQCVYAGYLYMAQRAVTDNQDCLKEFRIGTELVWADLSDELDTNTNGSLEFARHVLSSLVILNRLQSPEHVAVTKRIWENGPPRSYREKMDISEVLAINAEIIRAVNSI